jgi:Mg-chelatase subunit ChlD
VEPRARRPREERDRSWLWRAAIAGVLLAGVADPRLEGWGPRTIEVLIDDAPSMHAVEGGASRIGAAGRELAEAVTSVRGADLRVATLRGSGAPLVLRRESRASWPAALHEWLSGLGQEPGPASDAGAERDRETWLVTDAVDPAIAGWTRPVDRVIRVGAETENAGLTRLALRGLPDGIDRWLGLARVSNAGRAVAHRRLQVHSGADLVWDEELEITAGESLQRIFSVSGPHPPELRARLLPADALAADDALSLPAGRLAPVAVRVDPRCDHYLRSALGVHPALAVGAPISEDLVVWCSDAPPKSERPLLWFRTGHPGGPPRTGEEPVRVLGSSPMRIEVVSGSGSPEERRRPEYAVFIADLLDRAVGRDLLDRSAAVERPEAWLRIAPGPPPDSTSSQRGSGAGAARDLAGLAALLAALLLLVDTRPGTREIGSLAPPLALASLLALAAWNPVVPWGRRSIDLALLLDDSLSVERRDVDLAWRRIGDWMGALRGEGRIHVLRFAASAATEVSGEALSEFLGSERYDPATPPRTALLDRAATDLGHALEAAERSRRRGQPLRIVLVSDGIGTHGKPEPVLQRLLRAGVPVAVLPLLSTRSDAAGIEALEVPARAGVGERIPVRAVLRGGSGVRATLRLRVDGAQTLSEAVELRAGERTPVLFELAPAAVGRHEIEAWLETPPDPVRERDRRSAGFEVEGLPSVHFVRSDEGSEPPLARSLREGGWQVRILRSPEVEAVWRSGETPALVVLDDLSLADAPETTWLALARLVRFEGAGLLVLGGPHSFSTGGYRGSRLEELLPVVAEPSRPRSRAAVLFLVDSSGSMERDRSGRDRLGVAEAVVSASLETVDPDDWVGIWSFDLEPRELRPLSPRGERAPALPALPAASGGTRLEPALRRGVESLARVPADQRLVVLLTDGFAPDEALASIRERMEAEEIDLLAIAIGTDVDLSLLERLVPRSGGRLLRVEDELLVPRLAQAELGRELERARLELVRPIESVSLPFALRVESWPELEGYAVTRARSSATVFLGADSGDPLLAADWAGIGRVAVLTAGLGAWAERWLAWEQWDRFAGGLVGWLARPASNSRVYVGARDVPAGLGVTIDALDAAGSWSTEPIAVVGVVAPGGASQSLEVPAIAPGRFEATLATPVPGLYAISVRVGGDSVRRSAWRSADRELDSAFESRDSIAAWEELGLVTVWRGDAPPPALDPAARKVGVRPALLWIALLSWLALIGAEASSATPSSGNED